MGRRAVVTGTTVVMAAGAAVAYLATLAVNRSLVVVRGASMEPTLWAGDHLLTRPTWLGPIRAGQVVVVADPTAPSHLVVKRVERADGGEVVVTGDHPAASTDSRTWGPLRPSAVRRVVLRRWPDLRTRLHR